VVVTVVMAAATEVVAEVAEVVAAFARPPTPKEEWAEHGAASVVNATASGTAVMALDPELYAAASSDVSSD
jgi:hypothetical protein